MPMSDTNYTIRSLLDGFSAGKFSPSEIAKHYHKKISANKDLNAYLSTFNFQLSTFISPGVS